MTANIPKVTFNNNLGSLVPPLGALLQQLIMNSLHLYLCFYFEFKTCVQHIGQETIVNFPFIQNLKDISRTCWLYCNLYSPGGTFHVYDSVA